MMLVSANEARNITQKNYHIPLNEALKTINNSILSTANEGKSNCTVTLAKIENFVIEQIKLELDSLGYRAKTNIMAPFMMCKFDISWEYLLEQKQRKD